MSIILMAHAPLHAAFLYPLIESVHAHETSVVSITSFYSHFLFPESVRYEEFPLTSHPKYRDALRTATARRGSTPISAQEATIEIAAASTIYSFAPRQAGFSRHYHAERVLRKLNGDADIKVIEDIGKHEADLRKAVEEATPLEAYRRELDAVAVSDHFEFNYLLNSFPMTSAVYEKAGLRTWTGMRGLSAGAIHALLSVRQALEGHAEIEKPAADLDGLVRCWPRDPIEELYMGNLMSRTDNRYSLSAKGKAVADQIPESLKDSHLTARMSKWREKPMAEAVSEIDDYLTKVFSDSWKILKSARSGEFIFRKGDF